MLKLNAGNLKAPWGNTTVQGPSVVDIERLSPVGMCKQKGSNGTRHKTGNIECINTMNSLSVLQFFHPYLYYEISLFFEFF